MNEITLSPLRHPPPTTSATVSIIHHGIVVPGFSELGEDKEKLRRLVEDDADFERRGLTLTSGSEFVTRSESGEFTHEPVCRTDWSSRAGQGRGREK